MHIEPQYDIVLVMLRRVWANMAVAPILLLVALTTGPTITASDSKISKLDSTVQFKTTLSLPDPNKILTLINQERAEAGLALLKPSAELESIAQIRAEDMAGKGYYAHLSPDGKTFEDIMNEKKIHTSYGCENLDLHFSVAERTYVQDWMDSSAGHRQCILNSDNTRAGYAVAKMEVINNKAQSTTSYVVVGIHTAQIYR